MRQGNDSGPSTREAARRSVLARIAASVAASLDPAAIATAVCQALSEAVRSQFVGVRVVDERGRQPLAYSAAPGIADMVTAWSASGAPALADSDRGSREIEYIEDVGELSPASRDVYRFAAAAGFRGVLRTPLRANDRLEGTLSLGWREPLSVVQFDLELIELAGQYLAVALAHARQHQAAEAERARATAILNALPSRVYVADETGRFVAFNEEAARYLGLPADTSPEAVAAAFRSWTFRDADDRLISVDELPIARAAAGEEPPPIDLESVSPDGIRRYARVSARPVRAADGSFAGAVTVVTDVTEVREALEQSRRDERRQQVLGRVAQAVAASLDPREVGLAACQALREAAGAHLVVVRAATPAGLRVLAHDAAPERRASADEWLRARELIRPTDVHLLADAADWHEPRRWEDISALPDDRFAFRPLIVQLGVRGTVHIPLWAGDRFEGVMGIGFAKPLRDVQPDLALLEAAGQYVATAVANARLHGEVKRQRAQREAILASMTEGVVVVDRSGAIAYSNGAAAAMLTAPAQPGLLLQDLLGATPPRDLVAGSTAARAERSTVLRALAGETARDQLVVRGSDRDRVLEVSGTPIRDHAGGVEGAVVVLRDVTATEELDRLKDQFLSTIAHDVRGPLSTIKGYAQGIARRADRAGDANLGKIGQSIDAQVDAIDRLLTDLLDARRIDQGRLEIRRRRQDLLPFLRDALESIGLDPRFRERRLTARLPDTPIWGLFDGPLLRRVLENLLTNAVKYSAGPSPIALDVETAPGEARLIVRDEGIGIPADSLPHVFDQFFRAPNVRDRSRGQGLGLYVARSMVIAHNGRITVESSEGKGSTFTVHLPTEP